MNKYSNQIRLLAAVDCIIFGFDGNTLKLLLIKRAFDPEKGRWSLMGGFVQSDETCIEAANRVLTTLTGLKGVYLEQLRSFSKPDRDPVERTISIAYFALIDIQKYEKQITDEYHPEWFTLDELPPLIFDHNEMIEMAIKRLRYKAAIHPILFELLPEKFTLPQLQCLYEAVFGTEFDKRNFSRKLLSTGLLEKQLDKDKGSSKKGAFYYKLNEGMYESHFQAFLNIISNPHQYIS